MPDPEWGEVVAAVIVTADGVTVDAAEIRDLVRGRLRSTRVPAIVERRAELPYNEIGKLLRRVCETSSVVKRNPSRPGRVTAREILLEVEGVKDIYLTNSRNRGAERRAVATGASQGGEQDVRPDR